MKHPRLVCKGGRWQRVVPTVDNEGVGCGRILVVIRDEACVLAPSVGLDVGRNRLLPKEAGVVEQRDATGRVPFGLGLRCWGGGGGAFATCAPKTVAFCGEFVVGYTGVWRLANEDVKSSLAYAYNCISAVGDGVVGIANSRPALSTTTESASPVCVFGLGNNCSIAS